MTCFTVLSKFWNTFSFTMRLSFLFNTIHNPSFWTLNSFTFPMSSFIPSFQKEMMKTSFSLSFLLVPSSLISCTSFLSSFFFILSFNLSPLSSFPLEFLIAFFLFIYFLDTPSLLAFPLILRFLFLFCSLLALSLSCGSRDMQALFSPLSGDQRIWETNRHNLHLLTQEVVVWLFYS